MVRSAPYESEFTPGQRVTALPCSADGRNEWWCRRPMSGPPRMTRRRRGRRAAGQLPDDVFRAGPPRRAAAGETVLVLGSAGGVGTAAVQIAKAMGAKVIAMVHRPHAVRFRRVAGCRRGAAADRRLARAVREHTDGRGVDLVVDPIGGEPFDDAIRALATEGRLLVIGFAAGGIPTVKVNRLLLRNVGVIGVGYGEFVNRKPGSQSVFEFGVAELVNAGLRPPPPVRFPLSKGAPRCRAWPTAVCSARSYWSRDELRERWHSTCSGRSSTGAPASSASSRTSAERLGCNRIGRRFADNWRAGYVPAMDRVRRGELPWTRIDDLHRDDSR